MTTAISTTRREPRTKAQTGAAPTALLVSAALFVATAVIVLIGHPLGGTARLHSVADYLFSAILMPIALSVLMVGWALRRYQAGHDGRPGRVGFRLLALGLCGFFVDSAATVATANPDVVGPLYPLAMLATIVGLICMAVGADHARVLPRWVLPALLLGWIFGGPMAAGGSAGGSAPIGFRGAALIFAAVATLIAVTLARRGSAEERRSAA